MVKSGISLLGEVLHTSLLQSSPAAPWDCWLYPPALGRWKWTVHLPTCQRVFLQACLSARPFCPDELVCILEWTSSLLSFATGDRSTIHDIFIIRALCPVLNFAFTWVRPQDSFVPILSFFLYGGGRGQKENLVLTDYACTEKSLTYTTYMHGNKKILAGLVFALETPLRETS